MHRVSSRPFLASALLAALVFTGAACKNGGSNASKHSGSVPAPPPPPGDQPAFPFTDHVDQSRITAGSVSFRELFSLGDVLFETRFNDLDGAGALVLPDGTP